MAVKDLRMEDLLGILETQIYQIRNAEHKVDTFQAINGIAMISKELNQRVVNDDIE